jgi:hypothetical protein
VSESVKTPLGEIEAPYGRRVRFDELAYESGLRMLRVTIREGARYTILEIDAPTATAWADILSAWAAARPNVAS